MATRAEGAICETSFMSTKPAVQTTHLDVRPIAGNCGAEIHGVDLRQSLAAEVVAEIRATLLAWKVVFFRDQDITQQQHIEFGRYFGDVTLAHPTLPPAFAEHPEILLLDNQQGTTRGGGGGYGKGAVESRWHTDVTFVPNPPMASILRGVIIPPYGGDTQFVNTIAAYNGLSEPLKTFIDGLHAVHRNYLPLKRGELAGELVAKFQSTDYRTVHPVVRVHPETGEKALYVNPNFTYYIEELSHNEGRHLLALLYEHMASFEHTCRFRWEPNSIAFWDNRATMHMAPTDVPDGMRRSMQRITIAGDVPVGPDGQPSRPISGEAFTGTAVD